MRTELVCLIGLAVLPGACFGQDLSNPNFVAFGGLGVTKTPSGGRGTAQLGLGVGLASPVKRGEFPFGVQLEGGYTTNTNSGIFSANYVAEFLVHSKSFNALPFVTTGYTRLFGTGNALNFGGGIDFPIGRGHVLRVEVRDYLYAWKEHDAAVRIGWVVYATG